MGSALQLGPAFCSHTAAREGDRPLGLSAEVVYGRGLELTAYELEGEKATRLAVTLDAEGCRLLAAAARAFLSGPVRRRA